MRLLALSLGKFLLRFAIGGMIGTVLLVIGAVIDLPIYETQFMRGDQQCFREYRTSAVITICLPTHIEVRDVRNKI